MSSYLIKKLVWGISVFFLFAIIQFAMVANVYADENILYQSTFDNNTGINFLSGTWSLANGDLIPVRTHECRTVFNGTNKSDYVVTLNATFLDGNSGQSGYGIYFRATNAQNITGYVFQYDNGAGKRFVIRKVNNGKESTIIKSVVMTTLMGSNFDITAPHTVVVTALGNNFTFDVDNVRVMSYTDSEFASGYVGLRSWFNSNNKFHDIKIVDINSIKVNYDSQGGSAISDTVVVYNNTISYPSSPNKTGYTFGGWYKEASCINAWNFASDVVTSNTTLYAKWNIKNYTVTFQTNGGTAIANQTIAYDGLPSIPTTPTKTGFTFGGWYHDSDLTHVYDFDNFDGDDTIIADRTIYVKWDSDMYTVSFNAQNGIVFPGQTVAYNTKLIEPINSPIKTGYTFGGWYVDSNCTDAWDFENDIVTSSFTMHAKWYLTVYNIEFDSNGGSLVDSKTAYHNNLLSEPGKPFKPDYIFDKWYRDSNLTIEWDFENDVVTVDIILYANWMSIPQYTVTVTEGSNGTVTPDTSIAYEGDKISFTITPTSGYKINTLKFNGNPIVAIDGVYLTPSIYANSTLEASFSLIDLVPPSISTNIPEFKHNINLNVRNKNSEQIENKLFAKSSITYATISNPNNFTLISYGMILKDSQGKWVDLPFTGNTHNGHFAVHIFGDGIEEEIGLISGQNYTLQAYLKYYDNDGKTRKVSYGLEKPFTWQ